MYTYKEKDEDESFFLKNLNVKQSHTRKLMRESPGNHHLLILVFRGE